MSSGERAAGRNWRLLAEEGELRERRHQRRHPEYERPYSEAYFKTFKYSPGYPDRFPAYDGAHDFCVRFVAWYNHEHRHSGIAFLTPADVHYNRIDAVLADHAAALTAAYAAHPERFA